MGKVNKAEFSLLDRMFSSVHIATRLYISTCILPVFHRQYYTKYMYVPGHWSCATRHCREEYHSNPKQVCIRQSVPPPGTGGYLWSQTYTVMIKLTTQHTIHLHAGQWKEIYRYCLIFCDDHTLPMNEW